MTQTWDPADYARTASFVPRLGAPVVDLLAPQPGELVLDLGCGDGALSVEIAGRGARVIGLDASPEMLRDARARGLDVRQGDAAAFELPERFDAVFTNAALHWVRDHDGVAASVARHLRSGGRFAGELGGFGNVAAIVTATLAVLARRDIDGRGALPWTFPTPEAFTAVLARHGLSVREIALIPRPTPLPAGMAAWLRTFGGAFLAAIPDADREAVVAEIVELLAPSLQDTGGGWTADYVRLRFLAVRERTRRPSIMACGPIVP